MDDQGAVVVKRVRIPAVRRDIIGQDAEGNLHRIPNGIPEDRSFDLSSHFKVIQKENSMKDEEPNDRIQREGAHFGWKSTQDQPLTGDEAEWYARHKGYSEGMKL